jgi:hypothetical protein
MDNTIKLGEVVASSELTYKLNDEEKIFMIKIGKPRRNPLPGGKWECPVQIGDTKKLAFGIDSFQAMSHGFQLISVHLMYLKKKKNLNIIWLENLSQEAIRGLDTLTYKK